MVDILEVYMKISAVNNFNYKLNKQKMNPKFNGLLIDKGCKTTYSEGVDWNAWDIPYISKDEVIHHQSYVYYPFNDESVRSIRQELRKNNQTSKYSDEDYCVYNITSTTLGKTLPFTEDEWNNLSKSQRDEVRSTL